MSDFTGEIISRMLPGELLDRMNLRTADLNEAGRLCHAVPC